ncbi:glycosyltransferase family 1 protein [Flavobacterium aquidurense]|uniref:glycosyltransferase family 4 protein n=1 Tax=Flavobacterium aquidurense TaxID=362413 RepID=UPI002866474C|nr:glycosyltransferase family 1 protein [Flavobacterium aquidurense]MDR7372350.1 mannosyltransferase [Flavobacterium aquidurense]
MKILLDNIIFSLQKAGGASVVWQQHLERLIKDIEFECHFLEYDNAQLNFFRKQLLIDNNLVDLKNSKMLFPDRYFNINSKINERHIFHSSYYRVDKNNKAINITTVHDFTYEYFIKGLAQKVHSYQKNFALSNSEGIICISESTKKDLLKFLPHIKKDKIKVIYNGVDDAFKVLKNENSIPPKAHHFEDFQYAIYVGDRKTTYKNFAMAVEACGLAKIPLLLIGGGELSEKESRYIADKVGEGNFIALLNVSVEDLNYYYNNAFCLLYPSLYEGFGIPVIEAQRAGCPVIATNSSSIPEVIGNKYLAIDNPTPQRIADKIKELSFKNNLRKETIDVSLEKSKIFSWKNTYDETTEFYKELYSNLK